MKSIKVLSPLEVKDRYLSKSHPFDHQITDSFNIFKIQEILPYLFLPNGPFRNTAHGFVLLQEGGAEMLIEQEVHLLREGDILLNPAGQVNGFNAIQPNTSGFMMTFSDEIIKSDHQEGLYNWYHTLLNPEQVHSFQPPVLLFDLIHQICQRLHQLRFQQEKLKHTLVKNYLLALLNELDALQTPERTSKRDKADQLLTAFKKLLLREIKKKPTPQYLASTLNVSVNHLNKVLKQKTKLTTSAWIIKRQLLEAQLLLDHTDQPIGDIAYTLGFEAPSYFSKFFSKHMGQSPSQYRKD